MNATLSVVLCAIFTVAQSASPFARALASNGASISTTSTGSITINDLTNTELEVLRDDNFRQFVKTLASIEDNYRRAGILDTRKMMIGALKGTLQYGVDDKYSQFIPQDQTDKFMRKFVDGEQVIPDGRVVEDVTVARESLGNGLAYVSIKIFKSVTVVQFDKAVAWLVAVRPKGLVIDLRGNPGGMTNVMTDIVSYFVPRGHNIWRFQYYKHELVFVTSAKDDTCRNKKKYKSVAGAEFLYTLPVVVLIDGRSVSSAEIMVGALRDARGVKLIGAKSFGKGVFQGIHTSKLGVAIMTAGDWYTPSGINIHGKGFKPDYEVKDNCVDNSVRDAQLDKAIAVLLQVITKRK